MSSPDVSTESRGREVTDEPGLRTCPLLNVGCAVGQEQRQSLGARCPVLGFIRVQLKPHVVPRPLHLWVRPTPETVLERWGETVPEVRTAAL